MREGINPVADRIAHLTRRTTIPPEIVDSVEKGDLSTALKLANNWYASKRSGPSVVTYVTLLLFRDLDDEARNILEKSEVTHPSAVLVQAELALLDGKLDEALSMLSELHEADLDAGHCTFLAELSLDLDPESTEVWYERAMELGGTVAAGVAQYNRHRHSDPEKAANALSVAGSIRTTDREIWWSIARAFMDAALFDKAVAAFERLQKMGVDFYTVAPEYAEALLDAGDLEKCEKIVRRMREYDDQDSELLRLLGTVLYERSDFEKSRVVWEQLCTEDPAADAFAFQAECARHLGDIELELRILTSGFDLFQDELVSPLVRALLRRGSVEKAKGLAVGSGDEDETLFVAMFAVLDGHDPSPKDLDPFQLLELIEFAYGKGRTDVVDSLLKQPIEEVGVWIDFVRWMRRGDTSLFVPSGPVPLWETTALEQIAARHPASDVALDHLAHLERLAINEVFPQKSV